MCLLFKNPTKICVAIALLYLLPTPVLSDLSFYSYPVLCLCLLCLDAWSRSPSWWPCLMLDFMFGESDSLLH